MRQAVADKLCLGPRFGAIGASPLDTPSPSGGSSGCSPGAVRPARPVCPGRQVNGGARIVAHWKSAGCSGCRWFDSTRSCNGRIPRSAGFDSPPHAVCRTAPDSKSGSRHGVSGPACGAGDGPVSPPGRPEGTRHRPTRAASAAAMTEAGPGQTAAARGPFGGGASPRSRRGSPRSAHRGPPPGTARRSRGFNPCLPPYAYPRPDGPAGFNRRGDCARRTEGREEDRDDV